jgi:UDP-N-acetylglucosamine--N-acetylmuramyl-(pentapeptide) pyrophosphoryl-undecaprenol N-acetylglucosamine transferase
MPAALAASDIVVMRAGASSIAEASACGGALVVVPYPHAGGHQRQNAAELERAGAAIVIDDDDLTGARLTATVGELLADPARREALRLAARAEARPMAAREVAGIVLGLGLAGREPGADTATQGGEPP